MRKGIVVLIAILAVPILILAYQNSGLPERFALDENLHNVVEYVNDEKFSDETIRYQNHIYHLDKQNIFYAEHNAPDDEGCMLSWNGNRFFYLSVFFSDTTSSPVYIYLPRGIGKTYFREDYDCLSEMFILGDTNVEVLFSSMFKDFSKQDRFRLFKTVSETTQIQLHSKEHPRIKTNMLIKCKDGTWYITFLGTDVIWECSDSFVELLNQNGLINKE